MQPRSLLINLKNQFCRAGMWRSISIAAAVLIPVLCIAQVEETLQQTPGLLATAGFMPDRASRADRYSSSIVADSSEHKPMAAPYRMAAATEADRSTEPRLRIAKALLVGVEEYPAPYGSLQGVREDVRLTGEMLEKQCGASKEAIKTLLDKDATKAAILKSCKEWLIDGSKAGDTVVLYLSGHGTEIWAGDSSGAKKVILRAFVPQDAKLTKKRETRVFKGATLAAFPLDGTENFLLDSELEDVLKQLEGRTVIIINDSNHPALLTDFKLASGKLALLAATLDVAEMNKTDKQSNVSHSAFTWYLLKGLKGEADKNKDGRITFGELAKSVETDLKKDGYAQVPQYYFSPASVADMTFATTGQVSQEKAGTK